MVYQNVSGIEIFLTMNFSEANKYEFGTLT